ncbi:hypothetical protein C8R45DRAFT_1173021 [Mycena sanguinolenta]|nr:hypothetical protein C8R45DRAFT_1173021 [Mycena sanguinolenta]
MDNAFRKIDIDIYDEDVLQEEELFDADPRDPAQVQWLLYFLFSDHERRRRVCKSFAAKNASTIQHEAVAVNEDDLFVVDWLIWCCIPCIIVRTERGP